MDFDGDNAFLAHGVELCREPADGTTSDAGGFPAIMSSDNRMGALLINIPASNATKLVPFKDLTRTHNLSRMSQSRSGLGAEKGP